VEGGGRGGAAINCVRRHEVPGEEERGDTVDFIGYLPYLAEKDKEEGTMDHLPVMPYMVEMRKWSCLPSRPRRRRGNRLTTSSPVLLLRPHVRRAM
jgi:hypothetical protein